MKLPGHWCTILKETEENSIIKGLIEISTGQPDFRAAQSSLCESTSLMHKEKLLPVKPLKKSVVMVDWQLR